MKKLLTYFLTGAMTLVTSASAIAQTSVMTIHENEAVNLRRFVPKGSYSGITRLSGNTYAVVSDSEQRDGFFKFNIVIDSVTGEIQTVENIGFYSSETTGRDAECVAYNPVRKTIYVGGERNNSVVEYDVNGLSTGRRSGNLIPGSRSNEGMESLCFDTKNNLLWTMSEGTLTSDNNGNHANATNGVANMLRLSAYDVNFKKVREYAYKTDAPENLKKAQHYAMGVSEIAVLDDGRILVLEREAWVPRIKYGAWVVCKLYLVDPSTSKTVSSSVALNNESPFMQKTLLWACNTTMSFNGLNWANYEGMCLGPKLRDGSQTVILISDSQDRYQGILQDWIKTIVIK